MVPKLLAVTPLAERLPHLSCRTIRVLDAVELAAAIAIVFGVNLLPAFGPPTWAVLRVAMSVVDKARQRESAQSLVNRRGCAVLVKGGHAKGPQVTDRLFASALDRMLADAAGRHER